MPWTILVIDDDEKLNQLLKRFLGDFDYTVYTAINAHEGLKKIRATAPDLIILYQGRHSPAHCGPEIKGMM